MKLNFEELVEAFRKDGYTVKCERESSYAFARGKGIITTFFKHSNIIKAENDKCFLIKWDKCPLVMKLPVDYETLKKALTHLGSDEGYEISNNYSYLDNNPYPYEC